MDSYGDDNDDEDDDDNNNNNNGNVVLKYQYNRESLERKLRHSTHHVLLLTS